MKPRYNLNGKAPSGIAGAIIYIAAHLCNNKRTQKEIADVLRITEVTIRYRYKEILKLIPTSRAIPTSPRMKNMEI